MTPAGLTKQVDLTSKLVGSSSKQQLVAVKWALLKGRMTFMSFFRALAHSHGENRLVAAQVH